MRTIPFFILGGLASVVPAWAVYAPIPEQEHGQALTITAKGGVTFDDNIFGAQTNAIDSSIFTFSPTISYNGSVNSQTFVSGTYHLTIDEYDNRPGSKTLLSHSLMGRIAHAFTEATSVDLADVYQIQKNPASALAGLPLNSNQSFKSNELDASFTTTFTAKTSTTVKARSTTFSYDLDRLSTDLDRTENLYGISGIYAILPELKGSLEYRYQTVDYDTGGSFKDKQSHFILVGADYAVAKQLSVAGRAGTESRHRDGGASSTIPYLEFSSKYDYAPGSFVAGGFAYTYEESSNVAQYSDTLVNRYFVNVQSAVTPLITLSASIDYEPSTLKGRAGFANADETTVREGFAATYMYGKNWTFSATYDYDHVTSADRSRGLTRNRMGLAAVFTY